MYFEIPRVHRTKYNSSIEVFRRVSPLYSYMIAFKFIGISVACEPRFCVGKFLAISVDATIYSIWLWRTEKLIVSVSVCTLSDVHQIIKSSYFNYCHQFISSSIRDTATTKNDGRNYRFTSWVHNIIGSLGVWPFFWNSMHPWFPWWWINHIHPLEIITLDIWLVDKTNCEECVSTVAHTHEWNIHVLSAYHLFLSASELSHSISFFPDFNVILRRGIHSSLPTNNELSSTWNPYRIGTVNVYYKNIHIAISSKLYVDVTQ